ncbi:MAG TPA: helix-turn-helix domain-containing protein [Pirellulales bacterium]|jgi:phage terminase Nu1 subunit (DNA packaging protein)
MNAAELAAELGTSPKQIAAWVRQGLPCTGRGNRRSFDPSAVRDWLVDNGHAEVDGANIVTTVAAVANYFGVDSRTVFNWKNNGMPCAAKRYDLGRIEAWKAAREASAGSPQRYQADLMRVRARREALELQEYEGKLVSVDVLKPIGERAIAITAVQLEQLPDRMASHLPSGIGEAAVAKFIADCRADVDDVRKACGTAFGQLADAMERKG